MYGNYLDTLASRFEEAFSSIDAVHGFDYGPEFEISLCIALRNALPRRFGVCRGFAVNQAGEMKGDDIFIYEHMALPTLAIRANQELLRKERVPIEAIYAYIEAKHTINIEGNDEQSLIHAIEQVKRVKELCEERQDVPLTQIFTKINLDKGFNITAPRGYPNKRNPIFGAIFARRVRSKKGGKLLEDPKEIEDIIQKQTIPRNKYSPDLFAIGPSNIAIPILNLQDTNEIIFESPFYLHGFSDFLTVVTPSRAFALAFCDMMLALDWIQLGDLPWKKIIANGLDFQTKNS